MFQVPDQPGIHSEAQQQGGGVMRQLLIVSKESHVRGREKQKLQCHPEEEIASQEEISHSFDNLSDQLIGTKTAAGS